MRYTILFAVVCTSAASAKPFMHIGIPVSSSINGDAAATNSLAAALPSTLLTSVQTSVTGSPRYIPGKNIPWPHPRVPIVHGDLFQSVDVQSMGGAVVSSSTSVQVNLALATPASVASQSGDSSNLPVASPKAAGVPAIRKVKIGTLSSAIVPEVSAQTVDASLQPEMSIQIIDPVPEAQSHTLQPSTYTFDGTDATTTTDGSADDETSNGDDSTDEASSDDATADDASTDDATTDDSSTDDSSTDDATTDDADVETEQ